MVPPGFEPGTLTTWKWCDNQLHHETNLGIIIKKESRSILVKKGINKISIEKHITGISIIASRDIFSIEIKGKSLGVI